MKISTQRIRTLLGLAAISGFAMVPLTAVAQVMPPGPPPAAGEQKPDFVKVRGMVREMMELRRAGKHDEANQMAERIKAATGNNPRVVEMLEHHKKGPAPEGQARGPRQPADRPMVKEKESKGPKTANINPKVRIEHMRKAAEHLDAAGIEGMAKVVRDQIAGMERRIKNAETPREKENAEPRRECPGTQERPMHFGQQPNMPPMGHGQRFGGPAPQRRGFKAPELQAAKPHSVPADANAALIGEIRKLRQEMGELRGQVKRLQAHAAPAPKRPQAPKPPVERPQ